jgi:protein-S-isoprenylcysteine O-methyltransferase Ste14
MAGQASPGALRFDQVGLMKHLQELRYLFFGRALPAVLFGLLGYRVLTGLVGQIRALPAHPSALDIAAGPFPNTLYVFFCAIPVGIYLTRPRPQARDGRIIARAAALAGTTMLLVVGALPGPVLATLPDIVRSAATPLTTIAFALEVFCLLYLRRNLSIIPEARRLVTSGPYGVIRHPLYAGEMLVAVGVVLSRPGLWSVLALGPFVAIQLLRAHYEEGLLTRTFPEYRDYARRTWRLIPLVW